MILPGAARRVGLGCWSGDRLDHSELLAIAERGLAIGGWTIVCIHGVGRGTHGGYVEADAHARLLDALAARLEIWTAPVAEVAANL